LSYPTISYDLWQSLDDPAARIDRVLRDRSHRLIIGLAINQAVSKLQCALMMTDGHGKFLRLRHAVGHVIPIPKTIQDSWHEIDASQGNPQLKDARQFMSELADFQSQAIESVKLHAGKYVDRILAVALTDPGLWVEDFDGRKIYCPLSDSQRIADLTGLTVIDNFPVNDVLSGGNGGPLEPLPLWLAFADRHARVASEHRIVILAEEEIRAFLLPASDGLDAELPSIQIATAQDDFAVALKQALKTLDHQTRQRLTTGPMPVVGQTYIFGQEQHKSELKRILTQTSRAGKVITDHVGSHNHLGVNDNSINATITGLLGILHIDQMQGNLPWLTGASDQRVLGRLTPGTPSNWRQLVREMSDFCPPAMKLNDAI
jgi:1,6-anhydro-N-acetylmuramate kinase